MKKSFLSMIVLVTLALLLLSAAASRAREGRSALEPVCFVEDGCRPQECGIRNCGMIDRGCGLGTVSCGECSESQSCDDGICRLDGTGHQCPCGGSWPSACEACPPPGAGNSSAPALSQHLPPS
ncbi:MAG TPA: hypothetical protein VF173_01270 [Thermoanaerobaculia bacterium]|nr:hypothetical protein [Thermoanaerobaculia bacterium]